MSLEQPLPKPVGSSRAKKDIQKATSSANKRSLLPPAQNLIADGEQIGVYMGGGDIDYSKLC